MHVPQDIFAPGSSPNERAPSAHDDTCDLSYGPDWHSRRGLRRQPSIETEPAPFIANRPKRRAAGRLAKGRCRLTTSSSARCNLYTKRESDTQFARSYHAACQTGMACRTIHLSNGSIMMRRPMVILETALLAAACLLPLRRRTLSNNSCDPVLTVAKKQIGRRDFDRSRRCAERAARLRMDASRGSSYTTRSLRKSTAISHSVSMP